LQEGESRRSEDEHRYEENAVRDVARGDSTEERSSSREGFETGRIWDSEEDRILQLPRKMESW